MPLRYQVCDPPVVRNLRFKGSQQRLDATVAFSSAPDLLVKVAIAGAPDFPQGMVTIEGARDAYRFDPEGGCVRTRVDGGKLAQFYVCGNGSKLSAADIGKLGDWTASPERLLALLDAWLDAVFVPVAPSAPGGFEAAKRVLTAILALPRAGWVASSVTISSIGDPQLQMDPVAADSPKDGVTWMIKDLSQAFRLLRIHTGYRVGASQEILAQVEAADIRIAVPPSSGHQRLAAAAVLRAWAAAAGPDAAERANLVRRVLTGAGIDPPDADGVP